MQPSGGQIFGGDMMAGPPKLDSADAGRQVAPFRIAVAPRLTSTAIAARNFRPGEPLRRRRKPESAEIKPIDRYLPRGRQES